MSVEANEIWDILKENSLQIGRLQCIPPVVRVLQ
jgi:hypothetical protein